MHCCKSTIKCFVTAQGASTLDARLEPSHVSQQSVRDMLEQVNPEKGWEKSKDGVEQEKRRLDWTQEEGGISSPIVCNI